MTHDRKQPQSEDASRSARLLSEFLDGSDLWHLAAKYDLTESQVAHALRRAIRKSAARTPPVEIGNHP